MPTVPVNCRIASAILTVAALCAGPTGSPARADTHPIPPSHTAWNLRGSAGIVDPARGVPRPARCDRSLYLEFERASHLADALALRIGLRPDELRPDGARRTRSIAEVSLGFRHLLLTDAMAGKWFMGPWLGLGTGLAVEGGTDGGFQDDARAAWLFRGGIGMDFSVSPGLGFFFAWEHAGRSPMLFHRKQYDADHLARFGLTLVLDSGGRAR